MDRQTDGRTERQNYDSQYRPNIAARAIKSNRPRTENIRHIVFKIQLDHDACFQRGEANTNFGGKVQVGYTLCFEKTTLM